MLGALARGLFGTANDRVVKGLLTITSGLGLAVEGRGGALPPDAIGCSACSV